MPHSVDPNNPFLTTVMVQTYIAAASVWGFSGDNHGPTDSPSSSYRTTSTLAFDPMDPTASFTVTSATGVSSILGFTLQASASGLTGSESSTAPGVYQVIMNGAASDPFLPGIAPPAAYSTVVVINQNTGSLGGFITQTQFPSVGVYVNGQSVYSRPETGGPRNLYNTVSNPFGHWPP